MGAFDPGARVARWQDEETEAQFWACNDIGSVPEKRPDGSRRLQRLGKLKGELLW